MDDQTQQYTKAQILGLSREGFRAVMWRSAEIMATSPRRRHVDACEGKWPADNFELDAAMRAWEQLTGTMLREEVDTQRFCFLVGKWGSRKALDLCELRQIRTRGMEPWYPTPGGITQIAGYKAVCIEGDRVYWEAESMDYMETEMVVTDFEGRVVGTPDESANDDLLDSLQDSYRKAG